jgi:hypothetical protein
MGKKRNVCRLLVGKPEGSMPLGRPRRRWMDNINMDLVEIWWSGVDWICSAHDMEMWRALILYFGILYTYTYTYVAEK